MNILVQWKEEGGGETSGEVVLPTLPVPGQHISFSHITNGDDDVVEFRVEHATWHIESAIVEGYVIVSRTIG